MAFYCSFLSPHYCYFGDSIPTKTLFSSGLLFGGHYINVHVFSPFFHFLLQFIYSPWKFSFISIAIGFIISFYIKNRQAALINGFIASFVKKLILFVITVLFLTGFLMLYKSNVTNLLATINQLYSWRYENISQIFYDLKWSGIYFVPGFLTGCMIFYLLSVWNSNSKKFIFLQKLLAPPKSKAKLTDATNMGNACGYQYDYNVEKYFNVKKGIFVGMERDSKSPVYIPIDKWNEQHIQIMGQSGLGKGVTATQLLAQSLLHNHAVIVIDPKGDVWTPNALRDQAEKHDCPFYAVDLSKNCPQFNILKGLDADQVLQLFEAGYDLADSGDRATDHYKGLERDTMKKAVGLYQQNPTNIVELWDRFKSHYPDINDGFTRKLEETANIMAINTNDGVSFKEVIENGGCIYVVGSTTRNHLRILQRMVTLLVTILIQDTASTNRPHVTMFLDELKHCLSDNVINAFGMVRSFNANIICAHQSL